MQKRKFDELISHFNRKVSEMSIEQKYKMELLGMISAIGFAHEKELGTNLASLGTDCISRQAAIDAVMECYDNDELFEVYEWKLNELPPIQPEPHWIPVDLENNEPPLEEWVLVSSDGYVMQDCIVERGGKKIWYHSGNIQPDDRYMPLPEPFKGVTE